MLGPRAFKRLHDLDDHLLAEVKDRLLRGCSAISVALVIQQDWRRCTDVSPPSLQRQLDRFRERVILPGIANGDYKLPQGASRVDVIEQLNWLIWRQEKRVNKLLQREADMPILLSATGVEIERLAKMLDSLGRLQLEVGALKRAPRPIAARIKVIEEPGSGVVDPSVISFRVKEWDAADGP